MSTNNLRRNPPSASRRIQLLYIGSLLVTALVTTRSEAAPSRVAANRSSTGIPNSQPETKALDAELLRLSGQSKTAAKQIKQLQAEVRSARKEVDRAIRVTGEVRKMDGRLDRLIDRLQVYRSVPYARTPVKILIANLKKLKATIHALRKKSDPAERNMLRPLARKLKTFESALRKPLAKLNQVARSADMARGRLLSASRLARRQRTAQAALEQSSRLIRPTATTLANTVARFNKEAFAVRSDVYSVRKEFASFWTVERSLNTMSRQMGPGEKVAGDLDRVLSKRISIKVPLSRKTVSFTTRQILETPGKVLDVVLKPLEAIAKKALSPVLRKLKVRIDPPRGLAAMSRSLDAITRNGGKLTKSMSSLDAKHAKELGPQAAGLTRALVKQRLN